MALRISSALLETIQRHAVREYPNECCGALLGMVDERGKYVCEVVALSNLRTTPEAAAELLPIPLSCPSPADRSYFLDPREQIQLQRRARGARLTVLGYYHSHPEFPSLPSSHDHELALPNYSYIIVPVANGQANEVTSWQFDHQASKFIPETINIL